MSEQDFNKRLNEALKDSDLEIRHGQVEETRDDTDSNASGQGMAMGMRISVEFVAAIIAGVVVGRGLDTWWGTDPWMLILFIFLGFGAGLLNIYRMLNNIPEGLGLNREEFKEKVLTKASKSPTSERTD